jgi:hypothetical protein
MRPITFIDTSVLCNIIPVPGFAQDEAKIRAELKDLIDSQTSFILPITSVIETGNHISQLPNGAQRRQAADKFAKLLNLVRLNKTPWILHDIPWNQDFLGEFLSGADTGVAFVDHAVQQLGAGDLCILTERRLYETRTRIRADIWTLDANLSSYS